MLILVMSYLIGALVWAEMVVQTVLSSNQVDLLLLLYLSRFFGIILSTKYIFTHYFILV